MKAAFYAANLLIAVDYALIGLFFLGRLRVTKFNTKSRTALAAMVLFFFGCMHTHLDLVFLGLDDPHWYHPANVASHVAQGVGGIVFWWLARKSLVVNIYDKVEYEKAGNAEREARLQYLAAKVGLIR